MAKMVIRFTSGKVLKIVTPDEDVAYGLMLKTRPYFAFYPERSAHFSENTGFAFDNPPWFISAVHNTAYSKGRWGEFLYRLNDSELPSIPMFFRQNALNAEDCEIVDSEGNVSRAAPADCVGLERSAVWSAEHIESRISDLYAGRPNPFVESMKVKL